jgi:hypothetical protein
MIGSGLAGNIARVSRATVADFGDLLALGTLLGLDPLHGGLVSLGGSAASGWRGASDGPVRQKGMIGSGLAGGVTNVSRATLADFGGLGFRLGALHG